MGVAMFGMYGDIQKAHNKDDYPGDYQQSGGTVRAINRLEGQCVSYEIGGDPKKKPLFIVYVECPEPLNKEGTSKVFIGEYDKTIKVGESVKFRAAFTYKIDETRYLELGQPGTYIKSAER
jgi:hypothetical protein